MVSLLTVSVLTTGVLVRENPCTPSASSSAARATTTLPQAVPLVTGRALLLAPLCHDTDGPPQASSFCLPFSPQRSGLLGLIPVASPCLMPLCWLSTAGSSTLLMRQTPRRLYGPTSFSLATSVTNSNHHPGEMRAPRSFLVPHISAGPGWNLRARLVSDAADARSVFQPEQCGFLHSLLFDCGCREQLMHNCLTFPFPSQLCLVGGVSSNLFEHERVKQALIGIFVSGFISCLALMTMSQFSLLCLSTDALSAFQPGQFRFLQGLLFDVASWTAGREQLMHMSHFPIPPQLYLVVVTLSSCLRVWLHFVSSSLTLFLIPVFSAPKRCISPDSSGVSMVFLVRLRLFLSGSTTQSAQFSHFSASCGDI